MIRHNDNRIAAFYRVLQEDYKLDTDIMTEDNPAMQRIKYVVNNELSMADKTLILLYAECMSYRKVAAMIGISHSTLRTEIKRIRKIIKEKL